MLYLKNCRFSLVKVNITYFFYAAYLAISFSIAPQQAFTAPTGDNYSATGIELVDSYTNTPLTFDGVAQIPTTPFRLTSINESFQTFAGFPGGAQVINAIGSNLSVMTWAQSGHVIEFEIKNRYGNFVSFTTFGPWGITFDDIDLDKTGPTGTPQVVGLFFDFKSSSQALTYNLDPFSMGSLPLAVGNHPLDPSRKVLYLTSEGASFDNYGFSTVTGKKLKIHVDSEEQFQGFTLGTIVGALGLSFDPEQPPYIDKFTVGVFVTGLGTASFIEGDYDRDGDVDGNDFLEWQRNFGSNVQPFSGADGNGNGVVDAGDYVVWRDHFGQTSGAASGSSGQNVAEENVSMQSDLPQNITSLVGPTATPESKKPGRKKKHKSGKKKNKYSRR